MTRHVDAETLGRFSEGDLSQRRAARVGAHLSRCGRCSDLGSQLAGVTVLLASTQAPPIPEHLAARISGALAAESALRASREPAARPVSAEPGRLAPEGAAPGRTGAGRRSRPSHAARPGQPRLPRLTSPVAVRVLAAAAAAAVIAGGSYALVQRQAPSSPLASAGRNPAAGSRASNASGGAAALGRLTVGPSLRYSQHSSFVPVSTATNYLPGQLTAQVSGTLSRVHGDTSKFNAAAGISTAPHQPGAAPDRRAQFGGIPVTAIEGCVTRIAGGRHVLLVDVARYLGKPATVIVAAVPGAAADLLWVVGPACSAAQSDVLARRSLPGG
jgi:hypothetical protein